MAVALVSGPVGCFIVWRRMAYFGERLAHSGLLGVGLGLLFSFNLTLGAVATAIVAGLASARAAPPAAAWPPTRCSASCPTRPWRLA